MATTADFIAYVIDQSGLEGRLSTRRMFGEYALYLEGRVVGFAADNSLFIKACDANAALIHGLPMRPIFPGSKDYAVADELLDDHEALRRLLQTTADGLPLTKGVAKRAPGASAPRASAPKSPAAEKSPPKKATRKKAAPKKAARKNATRKT